MSYLYAYYDVDDNNSKGQLLNQVKRTPRYIGKSDLPTQDYIYIGDEEATDVPYNRMCDFGGVYHENYEYLKSPYYHRGHQSRSKFFRDWIKSKKEHEFDVEVLFESDNKELISFLEFYLIARIGKEKDGGTLLNYKDGGIGPMYDVWEYEELKDSDIKYEFGIDFIRDLIKQKFLIADTNMDTLRKLFKDDFDWYIRAIKGKLIKVNENIPLNSIKWKQTNEVVFLRENKRFRPKFQSLEDFLKPSIEDEYITL